MLFNIVSYIRFGISLIKLWFRLMLLRLKRKSLGEEEYYWRVLETAQKHTNDLVRYTKMDLVVEGLENIPDEPVVYVGNHQSYIDIYAIMNSLHRKLTVIGKMELQKVPIIRTLGKEIRVLYLDRSNPREGLKTIIEAIDRINNEKQDVLIFPEGTRSKSHTMGEFHKGSFRIAQKTNAPIIPMVVNDAYKVFEETYNVIPNVKVSLKFLSPIYMKDLSTEDAKRIDEIVKEKIQTELDKFNSSTK